MEGYQIDYRMNRGWTGSTQLPITAPQVFVTSSLRHRPHRPGLHELGVDHRLAGVFLPVADVFRPARDPVHHELVVPADMRDRRLVALEIRGHVAADQGNILRHPQTPIEQELGRVSAYRKR